MNEDNNTKRIWDGYFDEKKDVIFGRWERCMICGRIPSEIFYNSSKLFTIWYCKNCKVSDYKPKNLFQKILIKIDKI